MTTSRSILFAAAFYVGSFFIVTLGVLMALFDGRAVRSTTRRWARYHRWCAAALLGVRGRVEGQVPT
ncbi:MAG TPA: 1-acyl-sn-glycerol-3-phosphate acyltransferase, partial [Sphingomonadaceae bacterium]|nr:1-acyl-sn-glycerol-3-phosphate acyltransferase [Sphingomonadaceae bacterium]